MCSGCYEQRRTTRRILEHSPEVRVVALTASLDEPRMMGVLRAGAAGYIRKDAEPETLAISEETVKTHVSNVLAKLDAENRAQAIVQALKRGLVSLEELQ